MKFGHSWKLRQMCDHISDIKGNCDCSSRIVLLVLVSGKKNIDYSKILLGAALNLCSIMGLKHLLFVFLIAIFLSLFFYYKDKCISSLVKEFIQKHKNVSFFHNKIIFNKSLTRNNRSLTDRGKTTIDCLSNVKISMLMDSTGVCTARGK